MKKLWSICMAVAILLGLAGCKSNAQAPERTTVPTTAPTTVPTTAPTQPAVKTLAVIGKDGQRDTLTLQSGTVTVRGTELKYYWGSYQGEVYLDAESKGHYSSSQGKFVFSRIFGSDRYLSLAAEGSCAYLIDLQSGKVQDPFAKVEKEILNRLSESEFSPDGKYALIRYNSGTVLELLNCETGERTKLPYSEENLYTVSGRFIDKDTVLINTVYQDGAGQLTTYVWESYSIPTGQRVQLYRDGAVTLIEAPFAYAFADGKLTLMDLRTGKTAEFPFDKAACTRIAYHTTESAYAVVNGTEYLLKTDGTMLPVK